MEKWRKFLKYDPIPALELFQDPILRYFVQRDLLESDPGPIQQLWTQQLALKILKKQQVLKEAIN